MGWPWLGLLACAPTALDSGRAIPCHGSLELSPESLDFGPVPVTTVASSVLTITNLGSGPLCVGPFAYEPEGALSDDAGGGLELPAGESAPVHVSFRAEAPGRYEATLTIPSSDPASPERVLPVLGTVTAPVMALSPSPHDFGEVPVGCSRTIPVKVSNQGDGWLSVSAVELESEDPESFPTDLGNRSNGPLPWLVEPSGSTHFDLSFTPNRVGALSAAITVTGNDPVDPEQTATFSGTGGEPGDCP